MTMKRDIVGCARCDGDGHDGLEFTPFTRPVEMGDEIATHWAICPTVNEPVLLFSLDPKTAKA